MGEGADELLAGYRRFIVMEDCSMVWSLRLTRHLHSIQSSHQRLPFGTGPWYSRFNQLDTTQHGNLAREVRFMYLVLKYNTTHEYS